VLHISHWNTEIGDQDEYRNIVQNIVTNKIQKNIFLLRREFVSSSLKYD